MFGQPSPFGSAPSATTNTPFGAPAPSAFGGATGGAFGSTNNNNATNNTTTGGFGGFGSAAPAAPATSGGFGGFGSTPAAPAGGGFGGFGTNTSTGTTNTSTGFGTNTATNTSTPFGAPAPATGGGLFGNAPTPATGGGLFGGGAANTNNTNANNTNAFGATNTNTGFGAFGAPAPAPANNAFGAFGAPAPAPTGGLFGAAAPAPSAFGAPATATNNNAGLFGSTTNTTNAFGSPAPAANAGGGLFGSAPTNTAGAANGTLAVPYQVTNKSDNNITISLQSITAMSAYESKSLEELRLQDYLAGNKGSQGQNNAAQGNTSTFGGFGNTNTANTTSTFGAPASGGLFGNAAPAPAFGAAPTPAAGGGLFGSAAPAPATFGFGAPAAPAPAFGGFGSPAPAPTASGFGGFGTAAAPKPGGLFGSPTPAPAAGGGLFGSAAPAPATGGGLFGSAPAPTAGGGLFGNAAAPKPGGLFGAAPAAPAPAGGGLFGAAPAPAAGGGLFGKAPAPAGGLFGAPAPTPAAGGGLFGAPAAGGGLFGAPAAAPAAGGGLFGATTPAPAAGGGLFGAPAPAAGGGLFGAPAPAAGGGLFGAPAPAAGGGLFGAPAAAPAGGGLFGATQTPAVAAPVQPPSADVLLAQQLAAVESQKKELSLLQAWRGTPPDGSSVVIPIDNKTSATAATNVSSPSSPALMASLLSYQAGPRSAVKIRPRAFTPSSKTAAAAAGSIGRGSTNNSARSPLLSPDSFLGSSAKKLVIKPGSLTPKPKLRLLLQNGTKSSPNNLQYQNQQNDKNIDASPMPTQITNNVLQKENQSIMLENTLLNGASPPFVSPDANQTKKQTANENIQNNDANRQLALHSTNTTHDEDSSPNKSSEGIAYDFYQKVIRSPSEGKTEFRTDSLPKLTKEGYQIFPTMEDIQKLSESELKSVSQFEIRRDGIGSIVWDGAVDVRGLDLDNIVSIEPKDVAVYDAAEIAGTKPPVGSKLNRPAIITMYDIWPKGGSESSAEAKERMETKITKQTKKMDAELLSYSSDTGIWKFRVKHFSRYGLIDDDSDDEDEDVEVKNVSMSDQSNAKKLDFKFGGRGGRSPGDSKRVVGRSRILAPVNEEDDISCNGSDIVPLASENEVDEISKGDDEDEEMIIEAAEKAYNELSQSSQNNMDFLQAKENCSPITSTISSADEGNISNDYNLPGYSIQTQAQLSQTNLNIGSSICAKLAKKAGLKNLTSSSIDFGMRMGKSFGVAWRPDGSLLIPKPRSNTSSHNRVWVQCRPIIKNDALSHPSQNKIVPESLDLLTTHLKNCVKQIDEEDDDGECPVFTLSNDNHQKVLNVFGDFANAANKDLNTGIQGKHKSSVLSGAFELIKILEYGHSYQSDNSSTCPREALLSWIRTTVESDVDKDVNLANVKNDKYGAVFAALTGVDTFKASCIAMKNDAVRLSQMIATSIDPLTRDDINSQMEHWEKSRCTNLVPKTLLRIYYLLSGNLGLEEALFKNGPADKKHAFDWKRRLGMLLWCSDDKNHEKYMTTIISNYEDAVSKGLAPAPRPWYHGVSKEKNDEKCLLFKLLKFYALSKDGQSSTMSLGETISPTGYVPSIHDVSGSFHLSAAVSMLDITPSLTLEEEMKLIDSYCFQLINAGMWEWAVFINLCCISSNSKNSPEVRNKKKRKAMSIVLRHWNGDSDSDKRKIFLQKTIGVPDYWFDMALAFKCAQVGDAYGYVKYTVKYSVHDAIVIFNSNILPLLLCQGGNNGSQNAFDFADILRAEEEIPCTMTEDYHDSMIASEYLRLSREVLELSLQPEIQRIERNDEVMALLEQAQQLENKIVNKKKIQKYPQSCFRYVQPISSSVSSSELSSSLLLLVTQLKSILAGHSIFEKKGGNAYNNMKIKYASQLATLLFSEETSEAAKNEHLLDSANMEQAKHFIQWKNI